MSVSGATNYNVLYNTFLGESKDYCTFVLRGIQQLYLNQCQGAVEECFREVKYDFGNIVNINPSLIGVPHNSLNRLDTLYNNLKLKIKNNTSRIQELIPLGATSDDKLYVQKTLLKYLDISRLEIRRELVEIQRRLRENQLALTKPIDRINMVSKYRDGYLSGSVGSYTVALELLPTKTPTGIVLSDGVTGLTSNLSGHSNNIEKFISNVRGGILPNYDKTLSYSDEYLFFFKHLTTYELIPKVSPRGLKFDAKNLLKYKNHNLFNDLMSTPIPNKMGVGLSKEWATINWKFESNLIEFLTPMLNYDVKKYDHYFNQQNIAQKTLKIIKGAQPAKEKFAINFTGDTTQVPLVVNFFKRSVLGTANDSYNNKVERNITIS